MSTAHPHLDEQLRKKRSRSLKNVIGGGVMVIAIVAALLFVLANAGKWGVPMFGFTNEQGSACKNQFLGHRCEPLTLADIEHKAEVDIPDDAHVLLGTWTKTHDFELTARLAYPQASAGPGVDALVKKFGECRPGIPNPLTQVQGVKDVCTMTNVGRIQTDGSKPDPRIWQVSRAVQADGQTLVHLSIRSR